MPLDFYYFNPSPPCRAVRLVAKAIDVPLNLKVVNVFEGETMKPDFLTINPQHTIPTLVDGHIKLWESGGICSYLASQYGKDDSLYPSNPKARCMVDQQLYFDMGTLWARWMNYVGPVFTGGKPDPANLDKVREALGWLNDVLKEFPWVAGNRMTVADFCLIATVSSIEAVGNIDFDNYTRIQRWLEKCKKKMVGYEEVNGEGAKMYGGYFKSKIEA